MRYKNSRMSRFVNLSLLLWGPEGNKNDKKVVDDHETGLNKCLRDY